MVIYGFLKIFLHFNLNNSSNSKFKIGFESKPQLMINTYFGWLFNSYFRIIQMGKEPRTMGLEDGSWF